MHRYRTDKEFSKKVLGKYGKINDEETLEGTWQDYAPTLQKTPRPSLKAIQFMIENQYPGKKPRRNRNRSSIYRSSNGWKRINDRAEEPAGSSAINLNRLKTIFFAPADYS